MGLRGPPPKPTALKLLEGNPGRRRLSTSEPQPRRLTQIEPPENLEEEGKLVFRALSQELINCGLLTAIDAEPLLRYVKLLLEYKHADAEIKGVCFARERQARAVCLFPTEPLGGRSGPSYGPTTQARKRVRHDAIEQGENGCSFKLKQSSKSNYGPIR